MWGRPVRGARRITIQCGRGRVEGVSVTGTPRAGTKWIIPWRALTVPLAHASSPEGTGLFRAKRAIVRQSGAAATKERLV